MVAVSVAMVGGANGQAKFVAADCDQGDDVMTCVVLSKGCWMCSYLPLSFNCVRDGGFT